MSAQDEQRGSLDAALCLAAERGDADAVRELLDRGANIHADDDRALQLAVEHGRVDVVWLLLDRGANARAQDNRVWQRVLSLGNMDILLLFFHCKHVVWTSFDFDLRYPVAGGCDDVVRFILRHELEWNAGHAIVLAVEHDRAGIVEQLLVYIIRRRRQQEKYLYRALSKALDSSRWDIARIMLARGLDGKDDLFRYAREGRLEHVQFLLEHGLDVHVCEDRALREAVQGGHAAVVCELLRRGADAWADHHEILRVAARGGCADIVRALLDHGAEARTVLRDAVSAGHEDVVRLLLDRGACDDRRELGRQLLTACECGHTAVARVLLIRGADMHSKEDRALCYAARHGHADLVAFLLEWGVNADTADGDMALIDAAQNNHAGVVALLLEKGAGVHAASDRALCAAAAGAYDEVIYMFMDRVADADALRAARAAAAAKRTDVVRLLIQHGADARVLGATDRGHFCTAICAAECALLARAAAVHSHSALAPTALRW